MRILFVEYELLANSGLFDAAYYVRANPDVANSNVDPLMHYLERGCQERRDPSANFDTAYYLQSCASLGESPTNALVHYLTVGKSRGLTPIKDGPRVDSSPQSAAPMNSAHSSEQELGFSRGMVPIPPSLLYVDIPRIVDGKAVTPANGGVSIIGWGHAAKGVSTIDIALDGVRITSARRSMRRPDVAAAHPELDNGLMSGFAAHLPPKVLSAGRHQVSVSMSDLDGRTARLDFLLEVQDISAHRGPWALRRKMTLAEVDHKLGSITRVAQRPRFRLCLTVDETRKSIAAARRTVRSLAGQKYLDWELQLAPTGARATRRKGAETLEARLFEGLDAASLRAKICDDAPAVASRQRVKERLSKGIRIFIVRLQSGDELGCDALLEFALAILREKGCDLFYSDELRTDPVTCEVTPFFKPDWSPDLHLSTNYLGRSWCADADLVARAGFPNGRFGGVADYELSLRLTEVAKGIGHISKVLHQRQDFRKDSPHRERRALVGALRRRRVAGAVRAGHLDGYYRIKRVLKPGRVSIIIPTCAAGGHIKTCLETLRANTTYQDYEIVCIENIPPSERDWKDWVRGHADVVIETGEQFNWSRYNNEAARRAGGQYFLFLNDDVEIIEPDWLQSLLEQVQRPEVGIAGPLLVYPDRSVQQAGMMLDNHGRGRHGFRNLAEHDSGYFGLALAQRNVIGVTGACLITRRDTFESLGGFDEAHAVINNDLDFCLRAWRKGLINVYVPQARLIHHELASRSHLEEKYDPTKFHLLWREVIAAGDPYFNRNLSRDHEHFTIVREPVQVVHAGHPLFARSAIRRILVIKLDHIGDCITAFPAIRRLKQHFPQARISVLAGRATLAIWRAAPMIAEVLEFNFFHPRSGDGKMEVTSQELQGLTERLAAKRFDLAIDLRKQPDTRHLLAHSGADILVGFDHQGRFPWLDVALEWDEDVPLRTKHGHVSDDLIVLVEAVAAQSNPRRRPLAPPKGHLSLPAAYQRLLFAKPLVCVHVAAGSSMRQWPPKHFAELIHLLLSRHRCHVALLGGEDDAGVTGRVFDLVGDGPNVFNLVCRLSLDELPKLLVRSALFVGNNSGPQHVAAGLGVPTVGIHSGVVDAREWGPLGPSALAVRRDMTCSPCFLEREEDCPRQLACLNELSVADVFDACSSIL